jgi:hypothetical protein
MASGMLGVLGGMLLRGLLPSLACCGARFSFRVSLAGGVNDDALFSRFRRKCALRDA